MKQVITILFLIIGFSFVANAQSYRGYNSTKDGNADNQLEADYKGNPNGCCEINQTPNYRLESITKADVINRYLPDNSKTQNKDGAK